MPEAMALLRVRDLSKHFPLPGGATVPAVDGVSFDLFPGQTLGVIGESGCGKRTLGRTILRALRPTAGKMLLQVDGLDVGRTGPGLRVQYVDLATADAKVLKRLRHRMQMIFPDPFSSLNPRMTVGQIVGEPLAIQRQGRRRQRRDRVIEMLAMVGLGATDADRYPRQFSQAQRQRIGIARTLITRPALVVADDPVRSLDTPARARLINLLADLQEKLHLSYVFVAGDPGVVRHLADRVAVMYAGRIVELGRAETIFADPRHPYTRALISAVPCPDPGSPQTAPVPGEPADLANLPTGCPFHPRCPDCTDHCRTHRPDLTILSDGRRAACHLAH